MRDKFELIHAVPAAPGWYAIFRGINNELLASPIAVFECVKDSFGGWEWRSIENAINEGLQTVDVSDDLLSLIFSPNHTPLEDYKKIQDAGIS